MSRRQWSRSWQTTPHYPFSSSTKEFDSTSFDDAPTRSGRAEQERYAPTRSKGTTSAPSHSKSTRHHRRTTESTTP